jgi:hypothetical protein
MPHEFKDSLDEAAGTSDTATANNHNSAQKNLCATCHAPAAPGSKLRYCGGCRTTSYCSKQCALLHWDVHKRWCKDARRVYDEALAAFEAQGGRKKDWNINKYETVDWYEKIPGLVNEIQLLAWEHRDDSPVIHTTMVTSDIDGRGVRVKVMPRSFWETDPRFIVDGFDCGDRKTLMQAFGDPMFCPDNSYMCYYGDENQLLPHNRHSSFTRLMLIISPFSSDVVSGTKIVEALTSATRSNDVANAFDWIKNGCPRQAEILQLLRNRATVFHGIITPGGSVPTPTRALNNEVAYMMMDVMQLDFEICLTGLHGAVHFNGRKGVIRNMDPKNPMRWTARLDDGACVSVKATNFAYARRGNFKRRSP